jgi:hypothetical protein
MEKSDQPADDASAEVLRLPSVTPVQVRATGASLASTNEFFSSLNVEEITGNLKSSFDASEEKFSEQETVVEKSGSGDRSQKKPASMAQARVDVTEAATADPDRKADRKLSSSAVVDSSADARSTSVPSAVPSAVPIARKSKRRRRPKREPEIEVQTRDEEPFHWRMIFTAAWLRRNSGFFVSLFLHVVLLLFMSLLLVQSGLGDSRLFLDMADGPAAADEDLMAFDLEDLDLAAEEINLENEKLNEEFEEELTEETAELDGLKLSDLSESLSAEEEKAFESGVANSGTGDGKSATFFGTKASGRKFVFVVDRSTSMEYGSKNHTSTEAFNRYDVAKAELLQAINSLQPHQEFYVVMFAHNTKAMFDHDLDGDHELIAATRKNKARFRDWLDGVRLTHGTDPREGLKIAFSMRPDAIFMLSDGEFVSERADGRPKTRAIVDQYTSRGDAVPVNTISLEVEKTRRAMEYIANKTGGRFRFLRISDYVQRLLTTSGPLQERAVRQVMENGFDGWPARHRLLEESLLPMLKSRSKVTRSKGQALMHQATFGLFSRKMPSVLESPKEAHRQWASVIKETSDFFQTSQPTALGRSFASQQKLLLAVSELEDEGFLDMLEGLEVDRLNSTACVGLIRQIDSFHSKFDASPKSIGWQRYFEARLNGKKPRSREELGKTNWSSEQARESVRQLFENRRKRAMTVYQKYLDPDRAVNVRERLGKSLISKYPETVEAQRVREQLSEVLESESDVVEEDESQGELVGNPFGDQKVK